MTTVRADPIVLPAKVSALADDAVGDEPAVMRWWGADARVIDARGSPGRRSLAPVVGAAV
jgi:hypothetical protein